MTEQILDLRRALRLLRRFWRTVAVFSLVGTLLAAGYALTRPPRYSATALVLLPNSAATTPGSQSDTVDAIPTDARIATSAAVLVPAGLKVDHFLSLATLQHRVSATPSATASVLTIVATGPSARETEALANAVADQLMSFVTGTGAVASSGTVTALQTQADQLTGRLAGLQKEIDTVTGRLDREGSTSSAGREDTRLLTEYTSEQTDLQLQLTSVKGLISTTELGQVSANQGTQVLQRATTASSSRRSSTVLAVIIGFLVGTLGGAVFILSRHRRDARLFTRDELARALGAPVALSIHARPKRASTEWVELFDHYEPSAAEQWNVRKAMYELGALDGDMARLEILTLAKDAPAATLAALVAVSTAASKIDTAFAFIDEIDSMPGLRSACQRLAQRDEPPRPGLVVLADVDPSHWSGPGVAIVGRTVDPAGPVEPETQTRTVTVVAVSAGTATSDQLARVAIAAADAGQPIRAILVANPEADDQTTGRFPEGPNRASVILHRRTLGVVSSRRLGPVG